MVTRLKTLFISALMISAFCVKGQSLLEKQLVAKWNAVKAVGQRDQLSDDQKADYDKMTAVLMKTKFQFNADKSCTVMSPLPEFNFSRAAWKIDQVTGKRGDTGMGR